MWYYGWLMFALLFAAICAAISIRFIVQKQKNFVGSLNIFSQRKRDPRKTNMLNRNSSNNTDVFRKIAYRCVCYPLGKILFKVLILTLTILFHLVPFFSKSWGVGIEIAAAVDQPVPYPIYVIDRIFSCLFGNSKHLYKSNIKIR
jgi:hypothetical protein